MLNRYADKPLRLLVSNSIARRNIIWLADKRLPSGLSKENHRFPHKIQEDKYHMARNLISAINKAFNRFSISKTPDEVCLIKFKGQGLGHLKRFIVITKV